MNEGIVGLVEMFGDLNLHVVINAVGDDKIRIWKDPGNLGQWLIPEGGEWAWKSGPTHSLLASKLVCQQCGDGQVSRDKLGLRVIEAGVEKR